MTFITIEGKRLNVDDISSYETLRSGWSTTTYTAVRMKNRTDYEFDTIDAAGIDQLIKEATNE